MSAIDEAARELALELAAMVRYADASHEEIAEKIAAAMREREEAANLEGYRDGLAKLNPDRINLSLAVIRLGKWCDLLRTQRDALRSSQRPAEVEASEDAFTELDDNILAALIDGANMADGSAPRFTPAFYREVAEDYRKSILDRAPRGESYAEVVQSLRAIDAQNLRDADARAEAAEAERDALSELTALQKQCIHDIQQFVYDNPEDALVSLQPMLDEQRKARALIRAEKPEAPKPKTRTCETCTKDSDCHNLHHGKGYNDLLCYEPAASDGKGE